MTRFESLREIYDAAKKGRLIPNDGTLQRLFPDAWPHVFEVMRGPTEIAAPGHALALIAATLPDWPFVTLTRLCGPFDEKTATLIPDEWRAELNDGWRGYPSGDDPEDHYISEDHPNPATALTLACFAALIAEDERK